MSDLEDHYDDDDQDEGGEEGSGGRNQGRWSREEHSAFIEGLRLHGREWKKIASMIPTRTVVQIRTHAQKFFQKQAKSEGRVYEPDIMTNVKPEAHKNSGSDKKRLKVSAPQPVQEEHNGSKRMHHARDVSAAAGGITPRTVAAATILLAPRFQSDKAAPHTNQWMAQQSANAAAVLDPQMMRRTSPRLAPYHLPPSWPSSSLRGDESSKAPPLFSKTAVEQGESR